VLIDHEPAALVAARANVAALKEQANARVTAADATRPPPRPKDQPQATLAFFDPPYASNLAAPALAAFAAAGWLAPGALCVVEEAARGPDLAPPAGFALLETRRYGAARITLLRYSDNAVGSSPAA
jgi:16S rRNA (guanine966-N2)-methyltransferase